MTSPVRRSAPTASSPPIRPDVTVIEKTAARVMTSHLLTASGGRSCPPGGSPCCRRSSRCGDAGRAWRAGPRSGWSARRSAHVAEKRATCRVADISTGRPGRPRCDHAADATQDLDADARLRDARGPRRRRARRDHRRGVAADLPDRDLCPGRASTGRAAATTTPGRRTRPGSGWSGRSRRSRAAGTGSRSPAARRRRPRSPSSPRARTRSSSATTSTAARSATSSGSSGRTACDARYVDLAGDPDPLWEPLTERTRLVWFETPTNPHLKVIDIAAAARTIRERAADGAARPLLVVDNTFASPGAPATRSTSARTSCSTRRRSTSAGTPTRSSGSR